MKLSFRLKAILGIALIEAVLLTVLIVSVMAFIKAANQQQIDRYTQIITSTFAAMAEESLISQDLDRLQSASRLLSNNPGVVLVRIKDHKQQLVAQASQDQSATVWVNFNPDRPSLADNIYQSRQAIVVGGVDFGSVEIGFDNSYLEKLLATTRNWSIGIAVLEMFLVALFSLMLGSYLNRQIGRFRQAAEQISRGKLGLQLPVHGADELAKATLTFNQMSAALLRQNQSLEAEVKARTAELEQANNQLSHVLNQQATVLESQSVGIVTLKDRVICWCNPAFATMVGCTDAQQLIGQQTRRFYAHEADYHAVGRAYQNLINDDILRHDYEFVREDGQPLWVELSGTRLPAADQSLWVVVDVTARINAESALQCSELKFRTLFESSNQAILILDQEQILDCNSAALQLFGCLNKAALCQFSLSQLAGDPSATETDLSAAMADYVSQAYQHGSVRFDCLCQRRDNQRNFHVEVVLSQLQLGSQTQLLATIWDTSERMALLDTIKQQANTDYLTGLCNRRYFMILAERELARLQRTQQHLSLLAIDIDYFKTINDHYGHYAGDLALQEFAAVCTEMLRQSDVLGRIGGEEFAILLADTDLSQAEEIAERLRTRLTLSKIKLPDTDIEFGFTVSIGVASLNSQQESINQLIHRADLALYQAKYQGRNRVICA